MQVRERESTVKNHLLSNDRRLEEEQQQCGTLLDGGFDLTELSFGFIHLQRTVARTGSIQTSEDCGQTTAEGWSEGSRWPRGCVCGFMCVFADVEGKAKP